MMVMISLRVRCPWRTRYRWPSWSRRCIYRGSNHLQKSSISQNMAISWLIGTSVGFRLHLGRYSHHTPVLMGLPAPLAYPEFRLYLPQGRTGGTRCVTQTRASSPSTHRQCPQCAKHHGASYRGTLQRQTDARADETGTDDL